MLLYNIAIRIYGYSIALAALFGNSKARYWIDGRKNWRDKIKNRLQPNERRVWFHCSSLGEFEQGRPLIEKLKAKDDAVKIVLTFFSPSGYEVRKKYEGADYVFYLPLDSAANSKDFLSLIKPEKAFFIKYDYWLNYISELSKNNISLYIVSAIFRPSQPFFKWYGSSFKRALRKVKYFFLQDESSARLLDSIGIKNYSVTGDTRFDRVIQIASEAKNIEKVQQFKDDKLVLVAGSTWRKDDEVLIEAFRHLSNELKMIFVPHEIHHRHIGELEYWLIEKVGLKPDEIAVYSHEKENVREAKVLIIDTIGLLSSVYHYGEMSYIGGGFGNGIHNILEAAVYGMPVFFGPNYKKFREAEELIDAGGAFAISSSEELLNKLNTLLNNKEDMESVSRISKSYVQQKGGATEKILDRLKPTA
jgi:3-deoxy-D-manno-octulosonic-acid transferase